MATTAQEDIEKLYEILFAINASLEKDAEFEIIQALLKQIKNKVDANIQEDLEEDAIKRTQEEETFMLLEDDKNKTQHVIDKNLENANKSSKINVNESSQKPQHEEALEIKKISKDYKKQHILEPDNDKKTIQEFENSTYDIEQQSLSNDKSIVSDLELTNMQSSGVDATISELLSNTSSSLLSKKNAFAQFVPPVPSIGNSKEKDKDREYDAVFSSSTATTTYRF